MIGPRRLSWAAMALLPAALALGAAAPRSAAAAEQLVYRPLVTDGREYRRVPYPKEAGPILVLADTAVVVEAWRAPVSYWPITREYLADFSRRSEPVGGNIEVVDESGAVTVVEPEPYVVWHPTGAGAGPTELVHGEAAPKFYRGYVEAARAAAEEAKAYQRTVAAHHAAVEAWLKLAAERRGEGMPPPPPELDADEPEPFRAFATEPREAAVLSLPAGTYTVRMRGADGAVVPGSERELVSFAPLDEAVGYVLRPEDRWTRPAISFAPDEAVYTTGRTDLFLQPVPVVEYEARRFTRLFRPQSVEVVDPSLTVWTPRPERGWRDDVVALALWDGDDLLATVPRTPYRVAQRPGAARGYTIEEFAPKEGATLEPDFAAMRVPAKAGVTRIGLVVGGAAGDPVEASTRRVRTVAPPPDALLFLPALLPLVVGAAVRVRWRRLLGR